MNGSKRKQLAVPMVALMVCAVAFIGIGYALTSSFETTDNNTISGGYLEVKMDTQDGNNSGKAIFKDVKIKYSTIIKDNVTKYKVDNEKLVDKDIAITNTITSENTGYYLSVSIVDDNQNNLTIEGIIPTITIADATISNGAYYINKSTTPHLTITLNGETENISSNPFKVDNIHVIITAEIAMEAPVSS